MASLNRATIIGTLGKDPELRSHPGRGGCHRIQYQHQRQDQGQGRDVGGAYGVAPGYSLGQICGGRLGYLPKGKLVYIEGRLQTRKWQDNSGVERFTTRSLVKRCRC
ncbi:single-stranded DNA-binding protein [Oryzomonas rubra]|uniref:single-stranded DNA-binding protein n=1 Tax=Oryzomonas rubra TaxID=2509454 RepID=UPI003B8309C4